MATRHSNAYKEIGFAMGVALLLSGAATVTTAADVAPGFAVGGGAAAAPGQVVGKALREGQTLSAGQAASLLQRAQEMALPELDFAPAEVGAMIDPLGDFDAPEPSVVPGSPGSAPPKSQAALALDEASAVASASDDPSAKNYGRTSLNSVYHYGDRQVDPKLRSDYPYRTVGWFVFVKSNGASARCSAQLIGRSILATAGHCVHAGGTGASGWIRSGTFYPAYANATSAYGYATAATVYTTSGWYGTGALDRGYDVALVVLNKRSGTSSEIGAATGTLAFCYQNCLQSYWYNSQLGYPYNYDNGAYLNQSEHLEVSDSRDYVFGTGMSGGSSGGAHIANLGSLNQTAESAGQFPARNILFAVMSWGYTDDTLKIGGASSLSGPGNGNNFKTMFNTACTRSRGLHGTSSCTLIP